MTSRPIHCRAPLFGLASKILNQNAEVHSMFSSPEVPTIAFFQGSTSKKNNLSKDAAGFWERRIIEGFLYDRKPVLQP